MIKRLIHCQVPVSDCNFRCEYCYIRQKGENPHREFKISPKQIAQALSAERLGGTCLMNLCGHGETLLPTEIVELTRLFLEQGHFVSFVTNGTPTNRIKELISLPHPERLLFRFSFHYFELLRTNTMEVFFKNIELIRKAGGSFTIEITPNDELEPHIDDIRKICFDKVGALPHLTLCRNDVDPKLPILSAHSASEYQNTWGTFDSALFDFKMELYQKKRNEFCHAGNWFIPVDLDNGDYFQCFGSPKIGNIFENMNSPIAFTSIGKFCSRPYCFNGHVTLVFGIIPELQAPNFTETRNRKCLDGSEWFTPEMNEFLSGRLYDSNPHDVGLCENIRSHWIGQKVKARRLSASCLRKLGLLKFVKALLKKKN